MTPPPQNPYQAPSAPAKYEKEFHTSELGPRAMFMAIASGEGFSRPRLIGSVWLGLGLVCVAWNALLIIATQRYFMWMAAITPPLLFTGAFLVVSGEPLDRGYDAPKWARVGLGCAFIGGIFAGLLFTILLHD